MKHVLDTNALSELMKANPLAIGRLRALRPRDVVMPEPVVSEIAFGLALMAPSRRKSALMARWALLDGAIPHATWSPEVSARFGAVKASLWQRGEVIEDFDIAIAAHALTDDALLVTSNTKHFRRIKGLRLEDWLSPVGE